MATWHTRLTQAREAKGIDKSELARRVGVKPPTVTDWESGEIKRIDADNMLNVCLELDINPLWLMRGRGPMHEGSSAPDHHVLTPKQQSVLGFLDGLTDAQQDEVIRELQEKKQLNEELLTQLLARRMAS